MRKSRNWLAIVLSALVAAAIMAFATVTVLADPVPSTPVPPNGTLTIHKYVSDTLTNHAVTDGSELTDDTHPAAPTNDPIMGVVFDIYLIVGTSNTNMPPADMDYRLSSDKTKLEVHDPSTGALITTFDLTSADTSSVTTGASGATETITLTQGIYLVVEDAHSSPTDPHGVPITISTVSPPFIVPVPMTTADGTGWIQNVHVYPKNETMSITKTADVTDAGTAVKVGDIVNYTITSTIPNEIAGAQEYSITDTLDDALDYQVGSVNVTADGADLTLDQDYTVSYDDSTRILTVSFTNGNPVVTDNGIAKLDGHKEVTITFAAQVNAGILGKADLSVPNEATLSFVNASGDPVITANTNDLGPVIHTAAIKLTKVDEDGTTPLPGAEFQIATSYENATHGIFLKKDPTTQAFVDSSPNATDTSAYDAADDYVLALTDDSATGQFVGLADTIDLATNTSDGTPENAYQKYWIVETQAPATYNLLTDPIEVDMYSLVGTLTTTDPYVYVLGDVVNHSGFTLPFAGGVGTVAFTVVGIVLIGTAIIVVSTKRRRKSTLD